MSSGWKKNDGSLISVTGSDNFDARDISIEIDGVTISVKNLFKDDAPGWEKLISYLRKIITSLNDGYDFGRDLAEEWAKYLLMVLNGHGKNLANPYSDIVNYQIEPFSENFKNFDALSSIKVLEKLSNEALQKTNAIDLPLMHKTIYIIAIGGTDSTFYQGLSKDEINRFAEDLYAAELVECFKKYDAVDLIPRAFTAKKDDVGNFVTNIESTIIQAYHAGIKYVAVIGNARTQKPIAEFLDKKFEVLRDLKIVVTAQPLLPLIRAHHESKDLVISAENGSYPGGHGHGFKYCLRDKNVQRLIQKNQLEFFIFGNGDNAVLLNWGANHFASTIKALQALTRDKKNNKLRIAFFFVWEYLRKGGFAFILTHKQTGNQIVQIFEAELAEKSGADIKRLATHRGGYNTNVATGMITKALEHFENLPMALKKKNEQSHTNFLFEASLGTAMTTRQNSDGSSRFDENAAIGVLGPQAAKFQQWNHISIRKRDDFFAYHSSLFKTRNIETAFGRFSVIVAARDATQSYPTLKGNFTDFNILNTRDFFEIFKDAYMDVDAFHGTLSIDLLEAPSQPRGRIKFEGHIKLIGDGEISAIVPAGELWVIRDKLIDTRNDYSIRKDDVMVYPLITSYSNS